MENIKKQCIKQYNWSDNYVDNVIFEYIRFLNLRNLDEKLSPSDDIDKVWHTHILNTKLYYEYCQTNFNKFIHHDLNDADDQQARKIRLDNSIKKYNEIYGPIKYPDVWEKIIMNSDNKKIYVKIIYTFDINRDGKRIWKPNDFPFDKQTLIYNYTSTHIFKNLIYSLAQKTKHDWIAIRIFNNNNLTIPDDMIIKNITESRFRTDINSDKNISQNVNEFGNYFVAILEEMTNNGYC